MVQIGTSLICLLFLCTVMAIQCRHPVEPVLAPNFLASLASRVAETEPMEVREYRTSCQREPGCRWRCSSKRYSSCKCDCGTQSRRKKNNSRS